MLLALAALWTTLAPAPQVAPDDDPVRVALYGRPVEAPVGELTDAPASFVGRAVRARGRFERAGPDLFRLCHQQECVRLAPEEGLVLLLRARAGQWLGQEVEVAGVFHKEQVRAPAGGDQPASFSLRFWRIAAARAGDEGALAGQPLTLEALVYAGGARDGQQVRVRGVFRGRNLHSDLPARSQRAPEDWVLKDDYYAVWVTGRGPEGRDWKLDPRSLADTRGNWLEVSGRPETRGGFVYLRASAVSPLAPPPAADAVAAPPAQASSRTPPAVVFSLPLEGDELAADEARLLIQFSREMDATSFSGRVRLRYAGEASFLEAARVTYDAARRTLLVETGALTAGRELECVLMDGIIDAHGQRLVPRQGAIVAGVVDVLRYRVGAAAEASGG